MANGDTTPKASTKTIDFSGSGTQKASTPRDRDKQCMNCGVERITLRGTDPLNGMLIFVGDKCAYLLKRSDDVIEVL